LRNNFKRTQVSTWKRETSIIKVSPNRSSKQNKVFEEGLHYFKGPGGKELTVQPEDISAKDGDEALSATIKFEISNDAECEPYNLQIE
jgi:hypothetical protein